MLREKGCEVDVRTKETIPTKKELIKALKKKPYTALLCLLTDTIDKQIFDACPTIKIVANYAVGFNNIDVTEAKKRNIVVTNTPVSSDNVAEHTIALILALTTRLVEGDRFVRNGKYKGWSPSLLVGTDLTGKILGLVGTGRIGEKVAEHCSRGFSVKIIYYDLLKNDHLEKEFGAFKKENLDDLLTEADIVSIHVPLLPTTHHLINAQNLARMKPSAFLINTARGPIVDEKALYNALKNKYIAGAALDVFEHEPKITRGMAHLDNVIMTPHIASSRASARHEMSKIAAQNIIAFTETGTALTPAK